MSAYSLDHLWEGRCPVEDPEGPCNLLPTITQEVTSNPITTDAQREHLSSETFQLSAEVFTACVDDKN